jgi:hypothetical protein
MDGEFVYIKTVGRIIDDSPQPFKYQMNISDIYAIYKL